MEGILDDGAGFVLGGVHKDQISQNSGCRPLARIGHQFLWRERQVCERLGRT